MELSEYENIRRLEDRHWWYVGMRDIAADLLRTLELPGSAHILDAGCGVGGGLKWLSTFGVVTGIDLHPLATYYASQVSARVAQASVQRLPFAPASFDLVTSFEVLYHIAVTDDEEALAEFVRVLRPGGWLLVRVPAHNWLRGAHDRFIHTRHRYAPRELRQKIVRSGLALRRLTSVGLFLLPAAVARRLIQSPTETRTDVTLPSAVTNQLLATLLQLEGTWLRRFNSPAGLSLLALAQKAEAQRQN
jgi:SAM-dependent methyltransferase